jgi:chemotaxis protein methyltransferase CheR
MLATELQNQMSNAVPISGEGREYTFTAADFDRVRRMIYGRAGINLNATKQNMVYSRLSRRLRTTGMTSFKLYLDNLEAGDSPEWQEFINALTTNLTSFFREQHHFPVLHEHLVARRNQPALIWCSAASTGEEPYSIAMTAMEAYGSMNPPVKIIATDIDTNVLETAAMGVYSLETLKGVSEERRRRFFLRGTAANSGKARVRPELRKIIEFAPLNLLANSYDVPNELNFIFCRNVLIYFDKPTQNQVLGRMAQHLSIGGLLFAGHSENFSDNREHFLLRGKTVYERIGAAGARRPQQAAPSASQSKLRLAAAAAH